MVSKSAVSLFITAGVVLSVYPIRAVAQTPNTFTVYASGLEGPRGLRFGPDGYLYVAEAGTGGANSTIGTCQQVPAPVGPYTGGATARISKIGPGGTRSTVASGFPSALDAGGDISGVADVAFVGGTLYALLAGGGCSHGNPGSPNGIASVNASTGQWTLIADLSSFVRTNPTLYESAGDLEPDGDFYSMIALGDGLVVVEANHGQIISLSPGAGINQVLDVSAAEGHIVPTAIAEFHGSFYVGNLNRFPINPQGSRIMTISKGGYDYDFAPGFNNIGHGYRIVNSKAGFTTVVAVDFGPDGLLYALELSAAPGYPTPGVGKVVRVNRLGAVEDVITGLSLPTGMTFGPDGRLYVANLGAAPPGDGQILRFDVPPSM